MNLPDFCDKPYDEEYERLRYQAEEYECAQMVLDDLGVPRNSDVGRFSLVGRIQWLNAQRQKVMP